MPGFSLNSRPIITRNTRRCGWPKTRADGESGKREARLKWVGSGERLAAAAAEGAVVGHAEPGCVQQYLGWSEELRFPLSACRNAAS